MNGMDISLSRRAAGPSLEPRTATALRCAAWAALTICAALLADPAGHAGATDGMAAWEREARERIAEHRVSPLRVKVLDAGGAPVEGAEVSVEMTEHAFRFGSVVNAQYFVHETCDGDPYRKRLAELFNQATLENSMKWRLWERKDDPVRRDFHQIRRDIEALLDEIFNDPDWDLDAIDFREDANVTVEWLVERGFTIRGHAIIYATELHGGLLPTDITEALGAGDDDSKAYIRERVDGHIRAIGRAYRDSVTEWDVVNEHMREYLLTRALNPGAFPVKAPEQIAWFQTAAEAAPEARLFLNDYQILSAGIRERRDLYEMQARYLLDAGAPLHGLGFQGHFYSKDAAPSPAELWEVLERFGELGLDLAVTEFGMYGDWGATRFESEMAQAEFLYTLLLLLYSHPAATGLTLWGFWDGQHWQESAPFFRKDWSEKPALHVYRDVVLGEWWADEEGETEADGLFSMEGHHGAYAITARHGPHTITTSYDLAPGGGTVVIRLPGHE